MSRAACAVRLSFFLLGAGEAREAAYMSWEAGGSGVAGAEREVRGGEETRRAWLSSCLQSWIQMMIARLVSIPELY